MTQGLQADVRGDDLRGPRPALGEPEPEAAAAADWMQMLALTGPARRLEPRRLRLRVFAVAGRQVSQPGVLGVADPVLAPASN